MEWLRRRLGKATATCKIETYEFPTERNFTIGDRSIVVRALTFAQIKRLGADLGIILEQIVKEHPTLDLAHFEENLPTLLPTLAGMLEQFLGKLFDVEPDYLMEHLTLPLAVQIVRAMLEVNQVPFLRQQIAEIGKLVKTTALA